MEDIIPYIIILFLVLIVPSAISQSVTIGSNFGKGVIIGETNKCSGTDKVNQIKFDGKNFQVVCATDESGGGGSGGNFSSINISGFIWMQNTSNQDTLNVNRSNFWDNRNNANTTQFLGGATLSIAEAFLRHVIFTFNIANNFVLSNETAIHIANVTAPHFVGKLYCSNITGASSDLCSIVTGNVTATITDRALIGASATQNYIAMWQNGTTINNSVMYQADNITHIEGYSFHVNGSGDTAGLFYNSTKGCLAIGNQTCQILNLGHNTLTVYDPAVPIIEFARGNNITTGNLGLFDFYNNNVRVAEFDGSPDGTTDSGRFHIWTKPTGGTLAVRTRWTSNGALTHFGAMNVSDMFNANKSIQARDGTVSVNTLLNTHTFTVNGTTNNTNNLTVDGGTLHVDADANRVGIGTTTPLQTLHIKGTSHTYMTLESSGANTLDRGIRFTNQTGSSAAASDSGYLVLVPNTIGTNSIMQFYVGGGAGGDIKMVINDNGNVGIGTTNPTHTLNVVGTANLSGLSASSGTPNSLCIEPNDEVTENAATTCLVSSIKYKENIRVMNESMLPKIMNLTPKWASYIDDPNKKVRPVFIAEDINAIIPQIVVFEKNETLSGQDGDENRTVIYLPQSSPRTYEPNELNVILIKAIQEQQVQINLLKSEVCKLNPISPVC